MRLSGAKIEADKYPDEHFLRQKFTRIFFTISKIDGFTMGVYKDSVAQSYAIGNGLNYTLLDSVPIKCGVEYANCFTDDNLNSTFHYTFTPETTQDYVLYSVGGCDTYAKLYLDGNLVAEMMI